MDRVILGAQIYPPEIGGAATYFSQLEEIFRKSSDYEPLVLTEHSQTKDLITYENDTPIVRVCPPHRTGSPAVNYPLNFIYNELGFIGDVLHIHPHLNGIDFIADAPQGVTPPFVYDYRGISKMIQAREFNSTDVRLSVSEGVDDALKEEYGEDNTTIYRAPVVVDVSDVGGLHSGEKEKFRCVFVAGLHRHKGLDIAVEAVRKIRNSELVIIGEGPQEAIARNYSDTMENVKYVGRLSHEDTLREIDEADLFVAPFSLEGDPRVILESLLLDTPVVSTDVGTTKERVGNAGIITDRNPSSFRESILEMMNEADEYKTKAAERQPDVATKEELKSNLISAYDHALRLYHS